MTVSIAEEMNPTRRSTMEDVHVYHPPNSWNHPTCTSATFIGVYDGHGGRSIVDYLEDHLAENVGKEWFFAVGEFEKNEDGFNGGQMGKKRRIGEDSTNSTGNSNTESINRNETNNNSSEGQLIQKALERAFLLTDIQSRIAGHTTSGATVACCVVIPKLAGDGSKRVIEIGIHAANAGDARIVLSSGVARLAGSTTTANAGTANEDNTRDNSYSSTPNNNNSNNKAMRLTHDHKSTDPTEISRIESSGGIMIRGRVLGVLAVSRSLGDHGLKEFVIGRPFLSSTVVRVESGGRAVESEEKVQSTESASPFTDGEFLIVACDGLWDVMEDQEAVDMVRKYVVESDSDNEKQHNSKEQTAQILIDEAMRRGSADNITVIVHWL